MPASGRAPNGRGSAQRRKRRVGGLATHRHPRHAKRKTRSPEGKVWVADHWPRQIHRCTPLWTYEYRARERKPSNPISGCSRPTTRAVLSGRNWDDPEGHGHPPRPMHRVARSMLRDGVSRSRTRRAAKTMASRERQNTPGDDRARGQGPSHSRPEEGRGRGDTPDGET